MQVEIEQYQVTSIVADDLKEQIEDILRDPAGIYGDVESGFQLVTHMMVTLEYYTTRETFRSIRDSIYGRHDEYNQYVANHDQHRISVLDITENSDGSADVTFDVTDTPTIDRLVGDGLKYALILGALDCTEEQLMTMATRGKAEIEFDQRILRDARNVPNDQ